MNKFSQINESRNKKMTWIRAQDFGLYYDTQIGNEDATTRKKLLNGVPEYLRPSIKKSNHNHI